MKDILSIIIILGVFSLIISLCQFLSKGNNPPQPTKPQPIKHLPADNHVIDRYLFIDVETANKNPASICAVAIATMHAGQIKAKRWFVRPPSNDFCFSDLHGITWDMVKSAPTFDVIWSTELLPRITGKTVVAHYAHFDISAILSALDYYRVPYKDMFTTSDTCILARHLLPNLPNHKLDTLAAHFGIKLDHHNPLSDVMVCADIFNLLLQIYPNQVMSYLSVSSLYRDKSSYNADFFDDNLF